MSRKAATKDEVALLAELRDLDKNIAVHEQMRREIPLRVLQPLVEEALGRVRQALAKGALPSTAAPPFLSEFKVGQEVSVTMSPEQRARVLAPYRDPETGEEGRLLITETGEFVTAKLSELGPATTGSPPPTPEVSRVQAAAQGGSPPVTAGPSSSGFRPGDRVETPFGPGTILQEQPGNPGFYIVTGPAGGPYSVKAVEMTQKL
jgi:hypothetical protein